MGTFEASNGGRFSEKENGAIVFTGGILDYPLELSPVVVTGMREFFQHERDEELGRWRWPEVAHMVVYPMDGSETLDLVKVLDERTLVIAGYDRDDFPTSELPRLAAHREAARAYFEAHPERKPWHDAKPWETWVFTIDGKEQSATLDEYREFRDRSYHTCSRMHVKDDRISAGRRIWPESD